MTDSSQPKSLSNSLIDDMFVSIGATGSDVYSVTVPSNTITITGGTASYTINSIPIVDTITLNQEYSFNWGDAEEFVDAFPDWQRVQDMCKKYPGLEIALRNFQTVYTLVKDDYDNPKDES